MLVISEMLTNVTFVSHDQQVGHQTQIKIKHACILTNACNIINARQRIKPVENSYEVKSRQINKRPNKGAIKIVIKVIHDVVIPICNNKHMTKRFFTAQLFLFK